MKKIIIFVLLAVCLNAAFAQHFSSVKCLPVGQIVGKPVIRLNTDDQLQISFDEISDDARILEYKIIHCNADWRPSSMKEIQYLDGGFDRSVTDIAFSMNTYINYTHYNFLFPNEGTILKISGNYKLLIYDVQEPDVILLEIPFFVTENKANIIGKTIAPKRVDYRRSRQEIEFELVSSIDIQQPYQNLKVYVQQNGRMDDVRQVQPQYIVGSVLTFKDNEKLIFDGLNEYRSFDTRTFDYNGVNVESAFLYDNLPHVKLLPFEPRPTKAYQGDDDINGQYVTQVNKKMNPAVEGEYTYVHFTFYAPYQGDRGDVYLVGELTGWRFDEYGRMDYDYENKMYIATLFLKQGFYDFAFGLLAPDENAIDMTVFEGNHQETRNHYTIYVYYQGNSDNYDRLIAVRTIE